MFNIRFTKIRLCLKATDQIFLPEFSGSTLRGGFGHALRKICCIMPGQNCNECMVNKSCVYASVFETSFAHAPDGNYKFSTYPHPFVIEPLFSDKNKFLPGEVFAFNLILIGKATEFLPYFALAFMEMGRRGIGSGRGRYKIDKITDLSDKAEPVIFDGETEIFVGTSHVNNLSISSLYEPDNPPGKLILHFRTPTRIKSGEDIINNLNFQLFMQNLFRRISLLAIVCENHSWETDHKGLLEKAAEVQSVKSDLFWYNWKRYSSRQKQKMNLGGFLGSISFKGDFHEFLPFIKAGEIFHVGKACTFGLGKYEMELVKQTMFC